MPNPGEAPLGTVGVAGDQVIAVLVKPDGAFFFLGGGEFAHACVSPFMLLG
ncbi:hypothetical protein JYG34_24840 [Pseudomonas entomophila]|uniref:hypothetical protein n=1 Tax=Pseudomonas entomophila TaxID=312306 RepID=UPI001BCC4737|nr:hypothetical protein [Pseudomonas entomophila]QVM91191.1 hypothetical protein JYG34_24840 [Pseudomonas entomophila]